MPFVKVDDLRVWGNILRDCADVAKYRMYGKTRKTTPLQHARWQGCIEALLHGHYNARDT